MQFVDPLSRHCICADSEGPRSVSDLATRRAICVGPHVVRHKILCDFSQTSEDHPSLQIHIDVHVDEGNIFTNNASDLDMWSPRGGGMSHGHIVYTITSTLYNTQT